MRRIFPIRCATALLLGVFVLGQLSGLFPGHYEHNGATGGHALIHAASLGSGGAHHNALATCGDECCAVHEMPAIPAMSEAPSPGLIRASRIPWSERTLAAVRPAALDPPPKLHPSA